MICKNIKFAWYPVRAWKMKKDTFGIMEQDGYIFWERYDLVKTIYSGKRAFRIKGHCETI